LKEYFVAHVNHEYVVRKFHPHTMEQVKLFQEHMKKTNDLLTTRKQLDAFAQIDAKKNVTSKTTKNKRERNVDSEETRVDAMPE
jgi:hypothetical protein